MDDKKISMGFWDKIKERGYFPISKEKNILTLLTKAISFLPEDCTVLDVGGNNFSEHTSSRTVYNLLKERHIRFKLHIADVVAPTDKLPDNVFFHQGDIDAFVSQFNVVRINLAVFINVLQEPINSKQILTFLIQRQDKEDGMFIVTPIQFEKGDNTNTTIFYLMRGYQPNSFYEGELEEILAAYKIERKIIEDKKEAPPELTKEAINEIIGLEKAKKILANLNTVNPKLQETIDSYVSALNGGSNPVVNYGRFQIIIATKI